MQGRSSFQALLYWVVTTEWHAGFFSRQVFDRSKMDRQFESMLWQADVQHLLEELWVWSLLCGLRVLKTNQTIYWNNIHCCEEGATTIMLRSLPSSTSTSSLMRMLGPSFAGAYDFLYLPRCSRQRHRIVEMAFINFVDHSFACLAVRLFLETAERVPNWSRTRVSQARIQGEVTKKEMGEVGEVAWKCREFIL